MRTLALGIDYARFYVIESMLSNNCDTKKEKQL